MKWLDTKNLSLTRSIAWIALALTAQACATSLKKTEAPVFYPAPPELPRIQYLTSFTGRRDIEEQSAFDRFIVGELLDLKVDKPYGIAVHDGKIYVCDTNTTVIVFNLKDKTFEPLEGAFGPGSLRQPVNISIDSDGTKYVSDPVRGQIVVFDINDKYLKAYGTPGTWRPVDAVPYEGRLYVVDTESRLIRVLDRESGEVINTIGDKGDPAECLYRPTNLAFDRDGYLYVTDFGRFQVLKFDRDGHFKAAFGKAGDNLGHFTRPKGIAVDREGRLYAVDAAFNNVQVFNKEGQLLMFFGEPGDMPGGFQLPAKVAVDYGNLDYFKEYVQPGFRVEYLIFVTSQFGSRRVNVFAYGQEEGKTYPTDEELKASIEERRQKELEKVQAQ